MKLQLITLFFLFAALSLRSHANPPKVPGTICIDALSAISSEDLDITKRTIKEESKKSALFSSKLPKRLTRSVQESVHRLLRTPVKISWSTGSDAFSSLELGSIRGGELFVDIDYDLSEVTAWLEKNRSATLDTALNQVIQKRSKSMMKKLREYFEIDRLEKSQDLILPDGSLSRSDFKMVDAVEALRQLAPQTRNFIFLSYETRMLWGRFVNALALTYQQERSWFRGALTVKYRELNSPFVMGPIEEYIHTERWRYGGGTGEQSWWLPPEMVSKITARTSRSPLRFMGPNAFRTIYWPWREGQKYPDLDGFRVAVNSIPNGNQIKEQSMEVFVQRWADEWEPMFFEKEGYQWVPKRNFMGKPLEESCGACHRNPETGLLSPRPALFIKTKKDAMDIGYKEAFVHQLMEY